MRPTAVVLRWALKTPQFYCATMASPEERAAHPFLNATKAAFMAHLPSTFIRMAQIDYNQGHSLKTVASHWPTKLFWWQYMRQCAILLLPETLKVNACYGTAMYANAKLNTLYPDHPSRNAVLAGVASSIAEMVYASGDARGVLAKTPGAKVPLSPINAALKLPPEASAWEAGLFAASKPSAMTPKNSLKYVAASFAASQHYFRHVGLWSGVYLLRTLPINMTIFLLLNRGVSDIAADVRSSLGLRG